jgi:hypothetical protein
MLGVCVLFGVALAFLCAGEDPEKPAPARRKARKTQLVPVAEYAKVCDCEVCMARADPQAERPPLRCPRCDDELGEGENGVRLCQRCIGDPFPADTYVRKAGWRIKHRPRGGPDIWTDARSIFLPGRELTIGEVIGEIEATQAG